MASKPVVYMDSCCFIDAVKQAVGVLPTERDNDVWHIKKLLEAHRDQEITVFTSVLSIAECVATKEGQNEVPEDQQTEFRLLLTNGQFLTLAQVTPRTGRLAQDLRWVHGLVLKGADAVHIASALEVGASEFITTDDRLKKPKLAEAASKLQQQIKFISASQTACLPDSHRQAKLPGA